MASISVELGAAPCPSEKNQTNMLPYYVYELRNPSNQVFYVGKGCEYRMFAHVAGEQREVAKHIKEIEEGGGRVRRVIVGRFETAREAFAVESVLIKWVYGFDKLKNAVRGHRGHFIRDHRLQDPELDVTTLPGIDIERPLPRQADGRYTAEQRQKTLTRGIPEKLEALREALSVYDELRGLNFGDIDLGDPDNPRFCVTRFSDAVRMDVVMQMRGDRVKLGLVPISRQHLEAYDQALTRIQRPFVIKNAGSARRYTHTADFVTRAGGYPGGIPHEQIAIIADQITITIARLNEISINS
jgi:hypothetical protein